MKYLVFDGGSSRHSGFFPQPFSRVPGASAGSGAPRQPLEATHRTSSDFGGFHGEIERFLMMFDHQILMKSRNPNFDEI